MKSVEEIKNKINEVASLGQPFLFGFDFELQNGFFIENPMQQNEVLWRTTNYANFDSQPIASHKRFEPRYIDYAIYADKFKVIYDGLYRGDSFLTNLTIKTPIDCDYSLQEILQASNSTYALLMPNDFVCFSPETFVKINANGTITSYPMKGTIDASIPNAAEIILNDYKESAEHYTIVDLIRSDLSRVATDVHVSNMRYIDHLKTSSGEILQVSSEVKGTLPADYRTKLGDILLELLPAGSISGAPKPMTVNLIEQAEGEPRGYYCGIFGYFDGQELDSAVLIRYIEKEGDQHFFRSGSGITINSDCKYEYDEICHKIYLPFV